ncbi:PACE efflux transporter [Vibrio sp. IB15]|uniref:PACE efflux transporter n=1 Tax=Vibrio chagasii TaxID=170679 RepID=A0A7V7NY37_9VIBR|nr:MULTISPECIES: PACE efflux transporter [Vibrio]KAB0483299.1 PACE efflux transporter [Vibrio chagasii]MBJ2145417.1 PACE efflux transporter [Vibrio sp. IB15]
MSHKERILHMVLFEVFALIMMAGLATYITGHGAGEMAGLALAMSLIAMAWNYVYNYGYDKIFGADRTKRTKKTRVLHGLGFELGLMTVTLPVLIWVLKLDFLTVLIMDIGLVIFFVLYAIGFNWAYDSVRDYLVTQGKVSALN